MTRLVLSILAVLVPILTGPAGLPSPVPAAPAERPATPDPVSMNFNDYIWPTDASTKLTSSFAEYRSTHFHGGIDISTNGKKGYRVFAVHGGYVCRIRIAANGYGKMLYVKHDDGYVSTYAHLDRFNEAITRAAREIQYLHGTYAIDTTFGPESLPVRKGEVIAYTGDTGFGPPHLHFELRDSKLNPVNPMLCPNFDIPDRIPPVIRRVMIAPLDQRSLVDNSASVKLLSRFPRRRDRQLVIPQLLVLHGRIGFGVDADDRANGTAGKAGIYSLKFSVDDSLIFSMSMDRVPAEETKQIDLDYDLPMILQGWGRFQKLYIETGNSLPFYGGKPVGTGIINTEMLADGKHRYLVSCSDYHGNTTRLGGTFLVNRSPSVRILQVDHDGITLTSPDMTLVDRFTVYGKKLRSGTWSQHTFPRGKFEADGTGAELPLDAMQYDVVKVVADTRWGFHSVPQFRFVRKPQESARPVYVKTEQLNHYVRFTVSSTGMFTEIPSLIVHEGGIERPVPLDAVDLYKEVGTYIPVDTIAGPRRVEVRAEINGKPVLAGDRFSMYPVPSAKAGSFSVQPGGLRVSYDSGAVYRPLFMQVTSDNFRGSTVYTFEPQDQLIDEGIRISVPYDEAQERRHSGLFFRSNGGWIFQTDRPDAGGRFLTATLTRTLGELAVLSDNEPPKLGRLRLVSRNRGVFVGFRYSDNLSGVDTDEIKLYIDGKLVIPEIDGEHRQVWYQSDTALDRGKHTLTLSVRDRMKNETELSKVFHVK